MTYLCMSPGMPRVVNGYSDMEFVITPTTFHVLVDHIYDNRRIFTDGRPWPDPLPPTLLGFSIGQWVDTNGDGKYDVLEVETRGFRGPRAFDATGLPLHHDNQTVIKEKFYIDAKDPTVSHDEITVIDHALTHPWTVVKNYKRVAGAASVLARGELPRRQRQRPRRQRRLHDQQRRLPDADREGPEGAGPAIFQIEGRAVGTLSPEGRGWGEGRACDIDTSRPLCSDSFAEGAMCLRIHSNTSVAPASKSAGTVTPSARAALRLTASSIRADCCTGRSAGRSPLRMRPT